MILEEGIINKVELDNYSEVNCSAVFAKTPSKPALDFLPTKILARDKGYPIVADNGESTLIPGCFIAGSCLKHYTKALEQNLIWTILKDF